MGNFFGWIEVGYVFEEDTSFEEVLSSVKQQFQEQLQKDRIAMNMNGYVRIEKNPFVRAVPLEIKKFFLMAGANLGSRSITAVYSNIGIIRLPEEYKEYIERFGIFASTDSLQLCSCSYGEQLVLGFTSKIPDDSIQRNFMKMLKKEEISYKEEKNEFPGCGEIQQKNSKVMQTFSFLCIVVAVVCGMLNYLDSGNAELVLVCGSRLFLWLAGGLCGLPAKRRNILKNETWQLLIITVLCILWDHFTGWRGWSLDFVFPIWKSGCAGFCTGDCQSKSSGIRRISVLFYAGSNDRTVYR